MHAEDRRSKNGRSERRSKKAIEWISNGGVEKVNVGRDDVSDDFYYSVQEYETFEDGACLFESHRKYVDIQWVVEGLERLYVDDISHLEPVEEYNAEKDVIHYKENGCPTSILLTKGSSAILLPKDAHKPGRVLGMHSRVKKVVGKVRI